jgi:hypothetical protein
MERKFILKVALINGETHEEIILLTDDKEGVYEAFCETCEDIRDFVGGFETFTLYDSLNEIVFTEEIFDGENDDLIFCRWCGKPFVQDEDMYVENSWGSEPYHHCSLCHDILFTDEEWSNLCKGFDYDENGNIVFIELDEDEQDNSDSYYYTTAP